MSILRDLAGAFMPHFLSRRSSGVLANNGAEVVHDLDGDESCTIFLNGTGTFNATYNVQLSPDGSTWFDTVAFPLPQMCVGGTIPQAGQPIISEVVNAATIQRALCVATGQMRKLRIRLTAYTGGSGAITINSDAQSSPSPYVRDQKAATLMVTATAAVSTGVTATLPAVAGLRHYIDRISVLRSATAALTAAAAPVVVTTTNLPGTPALTFGSDAGGIGVDQERILEFGGAGLSASAINLATTVVCPVWTGVIWRVNVAYRLGL